MPNYPVRESVREVDHNNWIIGDRILLSLTSTGSLGSWNDNDGLFYSISEASAPLLPAQPLRTTSPIRLVYDAGDMHAAWEIGNAFLKVVVPDSPQTTREHITLNALGEIDLDFNIPRVIYHGEWDGRYYIILTKIPGQTLHDAWPHMAEAAKARVVSKITDICKQLAMQNAGFIGGIDGKHLPEHYLTKRDQEQDFSHENLLQNCQELEMDCSTFVFYHCDLGPGNIIIDPAKDSLGIIDWECSGFVPKEWIRTKFRVCSGMDLNRGDPKHEWRARVQIKLGEEGFPEIAYRWMDWQGL